MYFAFTMEKLKNILVQILQNRIFLHALFWAFVLWNAPFTSVPEIAQDWRAYMYRVVGIPTKMAATYLLAYYQIPKLLYKKKYLYFTLSLILSIIGFTIIYRFNNIHIAETFAGSQAPKESLLEIIYQLDYTISDYVFRVYLYTFLFMMVKFTRDIAKEKTQIETLQKEKTQAELNFLKAQIHPHFLFNTLNNLYALTLDKSDDAPEVVAKLAEILDYMLYQCNEPNVLINKEIELLQNYIDLEKLRYGDRLHLEFDYEIDQSHTRIAPLILISIIENAFKHGVSSTIAEARIEISLIVKNDLLHFRVFNTKGEFAQADQMNYKEGIGAKNIQRQLELVYPNHYEWEVEEKEYSYEVNLSIVL